MWEYLTLRHSWLTATRSPSSWRAEPAGLEIPDSTAAGSVLNDLGLQGWELVAVLNTETPGSIAVTFYFKRPR